MALALLAGGAAVAQVPPPVEMPPPAEVPPPGSIDPGPFGADVPVAPLPAPAARDTLRQRPEPPVLQVYRDSLPFQYDRPEAEGPSLWSRLWSWVVRNVLAPIGASTTAGFRRTVLILLAILVLGWVLTRLLRAEGSGVFSRGDGASGAAPLLDVEDIAEVDLGTRLREALARGDLREAVRLRYLLALQAYDAAEVVAWRRDKTNRQYAAEVAAARPALAAPFREATRIFDAVWYGERPVSDGLYARIDPVFDRLRP